MINAIKNLRPFLIAQLFFLVVSGFLVFWFEKKELHLYSNELHHPLADTFFKYLTMMAEGVAIGSAVLLLLLYKVRLGVITLLSTVCAGLITQFLKRIVFNDHYRPIKIFEGIADLHLVDGVALHRAFSFPSGHSTAAFALFLSIAFAAKKPIWQLLCFTLALLTAYSRVYLSQHFMQDIVVGSIIGSSVVIIVTSLLQERSWGNKGLLATFDTNRERV